MILVLIALYIFLPIPASFAILALSFLMRGRKTYWLLLWAVLTFSLLVLVYIPSVEDDAYRYFQMLGQLRSISNWQEFSMLSQNNELIGYQSSSIGFIALEMLVSKTAYFNLLPYINTVICLFSLFFPFVDLKERCKISGSTALFLSLPLPLLYNFLNTASTMRWSLACSLFGLIVYEYFEKVQNRRYVWMFLIPMIFHPGIILASILAIYVACIKKISISKILFPMLLLAIYLRFVTDSNSSLGSGNPIFQIMNMTNTYSSDFMQHSANGLLFIFLERLLTILVLIMALIVFSQLSREYRLSQFGRMLLFMSLVQFALIFTSMIFDRYILVTTFLALIYVARYISKIRLNIRYLIFSMCIVTICIGIVICYANVKRMVFISPFFQLCISNLFHFFTNIPVY